MAEVDVSKCKLTRYPTPVLMAPAEPIETINDNVRQLAERMIEIMIQSGGVGLAGPQAGVNLQIFVVSVDGTKENAKVYINPHIEVSGGLDGAEEGCLSLPGVYAKIKRHKKCTVTATDLEGNRFSETGEGLLARAFQHEYDHLQGRMIKDRMGRVQQIAARRRLKEMEQQYEKK
ncbi:MAG: peptide deformylase [Sedimentisphaerales bacterium]|nr:peptide deformylase [Sedimentisphaerales bacterium]